jgi:hypothetical protein
MLTTSVGLFGSFSQAMRAVDVLQGCGFSRDEISIVMRKNEMKETDKDVANTINTADKRRMILPAELTTFSRRRFPFYRGYRPGGGDRSARMYSDDTRGEV